MCENGKFGCAAMCVGYVVMGVVALALMAFGFGALVMVLWNWLMPELFQLPVLNYWQAVGLFVLSHLLFKSPGGHLGNRMHGHGRDWRHRARNQQMMMRCVEACQDASGNGDGCETPAHQPNVPGTAGGECCGGSK